MIDIKLQTDCIYWFRIVTHKAFIDASGTFWVSYLTNIKRWFNTICYLTSSGCKEWFTPFMLKTGSIHYSQLPRKHLWWLKNCRSWCGRLVKQGYIYVGVFLRVGLYVGGYKQHLRPLNSFPPRYVVVIWNAYNSERAFGSIYWVSREYYSAIFAGGLRCW